MPPLRFAGGWLRGRPAPAAADRLVRAATAGAGDPGHRHRNAGTGIDQGTGDHFQHRLAADRTELLQGLRAHAKQALLGFIAVDHHAAVEERRRPGDIGHALGDPATAAAFSGHQLQRGLLQALP
ncbi:hypothetical protein G6F35_013835 [Rhizopus arrhizus]|nr:hypothetical protein G6F35_013835 [Rhizopus arrhizus]